MGKLRKSCLIDWHFLIWITTNKSNSHSLIVSTPSATLWENMNPPFCLHNFWSAQLCANVSQELFKWYALLDLYDRLGIEHWTAHLGVPYPFISYYFIDSDRFYIWFLAWKHSPGASLTLSVTLNIHFPDWIIFESVAICFIDRFIECGNSYFSSPLKNPTATCNG